MMPLTVRVELRTMRSFFGELPRMCSSVLKDSLTLAPSSAHLRIARRDLE